MRVLDLFCGAGGASMGYFRAFGPETYICGVDASPMPNYPFDFVQADVFAEKPSLFKMGWDLIHASPPCHAHSTSSGTAHKMGVTHDTGWMLAEIADRLRHADVPWVIENVQGAVMPAAPYEFRLCGSSFGMDIRRHRKFITNFPVDAPPCDHAWQTPRFPSLRNNLRKEGKLSPVVGVHGNTQYVGDRQERERAMGIGWMTLQELNESIPPRFTEFIGGALATAHPFG